MGLSYPCSARKEAQSDDSPIPKPFMSTKVSASSRRDEPVKCRSLLNLAPRESMTKSRRMPYMSFFKKRAAIQKFFVLAAILYPLIHLLPDATWMAKQLKKDCGQGKGRHRSRGTERRAVNHQKPQNLVPSGAFGGSLVTSRGGGGARSARWR